MKQEKVKCILSALICAAIVSSSIPVTLIASTVHGAEETVPEAEIVSSDIETTVEGSNPITLDEELVDEMLPDQDELLYYYLRKSVLEEGGTATFSNYGEQFLTGIEKEIYVKAKEGIQKIAAGKISSTQIEIPIDKIEWTSTTSPYQSEVISEEVDSEFEKTVEVDFKKIVLFLLADCPYDLYWYDKTEAGGCSIEYRFSYTPQGNGTYMYCIQDLILDFSVSSAYQADNNTANEYQTDTAKTKAVANTVTTAEEIVAENAEKSDYEKLVAYKDKICDLASYDYAAVKENYTGGYGDPWQIIYVFDNDPSTKVVCEGYSKAFQYLCDLSQFEKEDTRCYTVTGTIDNDTHMWNIVTLDGKNYLVDVTNSDDSPGGLFLAGTTIGSAETSYTLQPYASKTIIYQYDSYQKVLYGLDVLTLASANYSPKSDRSDTSSGDSSSSENGGTSSGNNFSTNNGSASIDTGSSSNETNNSGTTTIEKNSDGTTTETTKTVDNEKKTTVVTKVLDENNHVLTETVTEINHVSEQTTEVVTEMEEDGSVVKKTTINSSTNADDLSKVITEETSNKNTTGNTVEETKTTTINRDGKTTSIVEEKKIDNVGSNTNATVTIARDGDGNVQKATAEIDKTGATKENGLQATFTKKVISQLKEAASDAAGDLTITMVVKDESDNVHHSITGKLNDLTANNTLYIYKQDTAGNYVMVNAKEYTTDEKGQLKLTIKSKTDFVLLNEEDAASTTKSILSTVKTTKSKATIQKSKTTKITLNDNLNMANVKSITYKSSKTSVATVNKNGKITAKKAGKTTVSALVTLKNGSKKTVKMTVTVK